MLAIAEQREFPGILWSIDCMHWKWKNCPFGWKCSHNNINVLHRSHSFNNIFEGRAPPVNYSVNGHHYTTGYYLDDGIYPPWSTFVKTISAPQGNKNKLFAQAQESARKDVEHAFGVLQARFSIVRGPMHFWNLETLAGILKCCIILHNMIVEDERDNTERDFNYDTLGADSFVEVSHENTVKTSEFIKRHQVIRSTEIHSQLQVDLVEHLWRQHGEK